MDTQQDPKFFIRLVLISQGVLFFLIGFYTLIDGSFVKESLGFDDEILMMFGGSLALIGIAEIIAAQLLFKKKKKDDDLFE